MRGGEWVSSEGCMGSECVMRGGMWVSSEGYESS